MRSVTLIFPSFRPMKWFANSLHNVGRVQLQVDSPLMVEDGPAHLYVAYDEFVINELESSERDYITAIYPAPHFVDLQLNDTSLAGKAISELAKGAEFLVYNEAGWIALASAIVGRIANSADWLEYRPDL